MNHVCLLTLEGVDSSRTHRLRRGVPGLARLTAAIDEDVEALHLQVISKYIEFIPELI